MRTGLSRIEAERDAVDGYHAPSPRVAASPEPSFATRLDTILGHQHETGADTGASLDEVLREMEYELFFGRLARRISRGGKRLIKRGMRAAGSAIPSLAVVRGVTDLARGHLRAGLVKLARAGAATALDSAAPWARPMMAVATRGLSGEALPARPQSAPDPGDPAMDAYEPIDTDGGLDAAPTDADGAQLVDTAERAYEFLVEELAVDTATPDGARRAARRALARALPGRAARRRCRCDDRGAR